tara:strand:- start:526 stop:2520 length:1995 start_codon:yes stop_codon:yes gene_type:complete
VSKRVFDIIFKTKGIGKATSGLKGLGGGLKGFTKWAGLAAASTVALSIKLAGDFQKSLKEVGTLMGGMTDKQMKGMSRELRHLSQVSGLALSSLSKAKYDVVSAGFANAADSAKILSATTRLAVGGVTSAATAADILTTALNAYGKEAGSVNDVSDTLFTTVKLGKTTMDELGASLGTVLPIARGAGLEFNSVGAAMASLTAVGINTAESTTALRGAIIALTAPAEGAKKAMAEAGISARRFDDGSLDLLETIKQFEGMDPATLKRFIPDIRAGQAIAALSQNIDGLADNLEAFEERSGATEGAFTDMMGTFNNQMNSLKNSSHSIMIEVGNVIIEAITPSIKKANEALATLGEIGFDEVAKRLAENFNTIKMIVIQSATLVKDELVLVGMKARNALPWWLGGGDEEMVDAINMQQQAINANIGLIKTLVDSVVQDITEMDIPPTPVKKIKDEILETAGAQEQLAIRTQATTIGFMKLEPVINKTGQAIKKAEQQKKQFIRSLQVGGEMFGNLGSIAGSTSQLLGTLAGADKQRQIQALEIGRMAAIANIAQGVTKAFAQGGITGFVTGASVAAAGAAQIATISNQISELQAARFGMDEMLSKPTLILAGEAGPERVQVTPADRPSSRSGSGMTINFNGPVTDKEFIRDTVLPEIQRVQDLGLA